MRWYFALWLGSNTSLEKSLHDIWPPVDLALMVVLRKEYYYAFFELTSVVSGQ